MSFANLSNGRDLRVWNLCRELARLDTLALATLACDEVYRGKITLDPRDLFCDVPPPLMLVNGHASLKRHLRLNEAYFYRWSYPDYTRWATELVSSMQKRHAAGRIVAFGASLAGFMLPFRSSKVLIDVCDSAVLHIDRHVAANPGLPFARRLRLAVERQRWLRSEARLPHWYSHVIAASEADAAAVRQAAGGRANVSNIPNGVEHSLEQPRPASSAPARRGVVFWGDMSYPVNDQAVRHFFEQVYAPFLAAHGVEWCIIGRNAQPWLQDAVRRYPSIRALGFAADLYGAVADYPVVVNPMVSGSGVKNKMLEALALGKAVVSTPLGMESITGAIDGVHYVSAATPEAMAAAVLDLLQNPARCAELGPKGRQLILERHTWHHVGEKLRAIVDTL
jgi:glycosyltransferase involved in cell wall biosynthesis